MGGYKKHPVGGGQNGVYKCEKWVLVFSNRSYVICMTMDEI